MEYGLPLALASAERKSRGGTRRLTDTPALCGTWFAMTGSVLIRSKRFT